MFERFFEWISEKTEAAIWRGFERVRQRLEAGEAPPPAIEQAKVEDEPEPARRGRK